MIHKNSNSLHIILSVIIACTNNALLSMDMDADGTIQEMDTLSKQFSQCVVSPDPLPSIMTLYTSNCSQQEKDTGLQMAAALGSLSAVNYLLSIGANVGADKGKAIACAAKNGHLLLASMLHTLEEQISANKNYSSYQP